MSRTKSLALAVASLVIFAGCKSSSPTSPSPRPASTAVTPAQSATPAPAANPVATAPAKSATPPMTKRGEPAAIRLGDDLLGEKDIRGGALVPVFDNVIQRVTKTQNLAATDSEIAAYGKSLGLDPADLRELGREDREMMAIKVEQWKAHAWLYKRHNGRVVTNLLDETVPVDAIRRQIELDEKAGHIEFFSDAARQEVFKYFDTDFDSVLPADKVDFTTPPWRK